MLAIYKKEIKKLSYIHARICVYGIYQAVLGIYFTAYNLNYASPDFGTTLNSVTFCIFDYHSDFNNENFSGRKRNKTDQLLFTSPVPIWKIVFGKYLGMVTIYLIPVVITLFYPLILAKYGTVSYPMTLTAIVGFFFLGCANIAVGLFLSSITESQVIAAVLTFVVLFCSFVMNGIESFFSQTAMASMLAFAVLAVLIAMVVYQMTKDNILTGITGVVLLGAVVIIYIVKSSLYEGAIQKLLDLLAIANHFDNFVGGILDFSGIVYMLSVICIFIFLTVQSIQKRRWS